jgi:hypothetical protein
VRRYAFALSYRINAIAIEEGHLTLPQSLADMGAVIPEFTTHLAAHVHSKVLRPLSFAAPAGAPNTPRKDL